MAKRLIEEHELQQAIRVLEALSDRASSPQQREKINKLLLVANQALRESPPDQPFGPVGTAEPVLREEKRAPDHSRPEVAESGSDRAPSAQETRITEADQDLGAVSTVQEGPALGAAVEGCKVRLYWDVKPKQEPTTDHPDQGGFDVSLILGFSRGHIIRLRYLRIQKAWSRWPEVLDNSELVFGDNIEKSWIDGDGLVMCPIDFPHDFSPSFRHNWFTKNFFCPQLGWHAEVWIEIDCEKSDLELEVWCFRRRAWRWTREVTVYQCCSPAVFPKEA